MLIDRDIEHDESDESFTRHHDSKGDRIEPRELEGASSDDDGNEFGDWS